MSPDILLARLEGVRKSGRGWVAKCPAHSDKTASLSICEGDNGTVLIHDFAGCTPHDVMTAVGLALGDLFPKRDLTNMTRAEKSELRVMASVPKWKAAMNTAVHEIGVVCAALAELRTTRKLTKDHAERIALAWNRLEAARAELGSTPELKRVRETETPQR